MISVYMTHFRLVSSIDLLVIHYIADKSTINYPTWVLRNTVSLSPVCLKVD